MRGADCRVYIAFGDGPLVASPTWAEVTADVREVAVQRGRSSELADFAAGTCTVELDNTARAYDPDHTAGPYFGNLVPRRQIKVECTVGASTWPVFRGVIESIRQTYGAGGMQPTATIDAVDLFGVIASWEMPETAHELVARSLEPSAWWPLDGTSVARDLVGSAFGQYSAAREGVDALEVGGAGASVISTVSGSPGAITTWSLTGDPETASSMACMFQSSALGFAASIDLVRFEHPSGQCWINVGDVVRGRFNFGFDVGFVEASRNVIDGRPHHLAFVRDGTDVELWVDGVSVGTDSGGPFMTGAVDAMAGHIGLTTGEVPSATLDEAALWHGRALTGTEVTLLAEAALTGFAGQRADVRLATVLDLLGVPSALRSLQAASASVGRVAARGDALAYLGSVARSDRGRLFVARDGVLTFESRTADMGATPVATFADDGTVNSVRYTGFELELDDRLIRNEVTVTGVDVSRTVLDAASAATFGRRSLRIDTQLGSADECGDYARMLLGRLASPQTRGRSWTVKPDDTLSGSTVAAWSTVMSLELGDVVTIVRAPDVGAPIAKTVQVASIAHEITSDDWTVEFTGVPVATSPAFRWGISTWGGADGWS